MAEAEAVDDGADQAAVEPDEPDQCPDLSDRRSPQILQYALEGYTWDQIARELKIHVRTLLRIRERDQLDELLDQLTADDTKATIRAYLSMRRKAFVTTAELMSSPDTNVRFRAVNLAFRFVTAKEGPRAVEDELPPPPAPMVTSGAPARPAETIAEKAARAAANRKLLGSGGRQGGRR